MTKHDTPSGSHAIMFAVRKSSLKKNCPINIIIVFVVVDKLTTTFWYNIRGHFRRRSQVERKWTRWLTAACLSMHKCTYPCNAFSPKKSPFCRVLMYLSSALFDCFMVTLTYFRGTKHKGYHSSIYNIIKKLRLKVCRGQLDQYFWGCTNCKEFPDHSVTPGHINYDYCYENK